MKIGNFRINKSLLFSFATLLGLGLVFLPSKAHANSRGQQIIIYYPDGSTTTLVSNGTDICTQVNSLSYASNCDYPSHVQGMGYVNGTHRVYANRNAGGGHQPVVTHPGPPSSYPTLPQPGVGQADQIFVTTTNQWITRNRGEDVCTQIRRQFRRECLDYRDLGQGRHQVSLGDTLQTYPTSTQNRPNVICVGGSGTDAAGGLCIRL